MAIPKFVVELLQLYADVFEEPKALPLVQAHDRAITLQSGARPINMCPYRYPHHQKTEIERLVRDMLSVGIIWLSVNCFLALYY